MYFAGLNVFRINPSIANMGVGQCDDLAAVAGISKDFLISGHGGIENHLSHRMAFRTDRHALKDGSVRER